MLFDTVYLARHGQTEWNVTGRRQGRLDSPLTPLGIDQASRNAVLLSTRQIDAVFTSPLARARRTAQIIADGLGLPVAVLVAGTGSRRPLLVSHEMIGRMPAKQLAGLTPAEALVRDQPSDVVYVMVADGAIDILKSAGQVPVRFIAEEPTQL
ncbi:histidine phosphatase family protein [Kribbella sp. DT2]|uniref:histidine phosphatase family protein n=1 Tax=Kribbella sp. DT2 TaxID=3393427 RepID=UPI003CF9B575